MNKVASCPLKLILFGEHSVLIGGRCISICINKYCTLFLSNCINKEDKLNLLIKDSKNSNFIFSPNSLIKENVDNSYNGIIDIEYQLGCGLGSSAAISILSSVALYRNYQIDISKINQDCLHDLIFKKANILEDIFHGKSSGVDCATLEKGGMISFINREVQNLSTEFICNYKILIYNSKISKDTGKTIRQALNNKETNYKLLCDISEEAFNLLSKQFILEDFYKVVRKAQECFEDLGVVPELMKKEVRRIRELGIESKITGAGNGGHLFTLVEKDCNLKNWEEVKIDHDGFKLNKMKV